MFPTQGSLGTNTQMDGWDGMGQGTHVCSVHAKKMHHALPHCSAEKGKASCRCGTTKHDGMTRVCQTNGGLLLGDFCPTRESWDKSQMGTAKVDWSQKGGGGRMGMGGMPPPCHTHRSVQSLTHEGRKKKIPFRSLSLSRMHAWRGERANIRRINGQSEDGRWWSCLCVQCTVLLREWAGEGRQTRWQSGLMGNFGHLCKGGGGRPKRGT